MTTVYWQFKDKGIKALSLLYFDPELLLPEIAKIRNSQYIKCPAFLEYYKNTYLIRSPIDIKITYDNGQLYITPQNQDFYNSYINHRGHQITETDPFLMSFVLQYLFIADKDCFVEVLPASFHSIATKIRTIQGTFNINKWFRPIEFAFEFINENEPLVIKRGDPLFYVKFRTPKDEKVFLEQKDFEKSVLNNVKACVNLKNALPNCSLNYLYKLAQRIKLPFKK